jgi:hypothetical protein
MARGKKQVVRWFLEVYLLFLFIKVNFVENNPNAWPSAISI